MFLWGFSLISNDVGLVWSWFLAAGNQERGERPQEVSKLRWREARMLSIFSDFLVFNFFVGFEEFGFCFVVASEGCRGLATNGSDEREPKIGNS